MIKRGNKLGIVILIIMLSVGFAAVTTSLIINGTTGISTNPEDFNVFFSYATASDGSTAVIEEGKKAITFTGKTLMAQGDKAILNYTIRNDSANYDANIELSINVIDSSGEDHSEYYRIIKEGFTDAEPTLLSAKGAKDGSITIELVKAYANEEFSLSFEVTLDVDAVERTSLGEYETVNGTAYDIDGNILANTPLVMFSEPTYFVTDDEGHYEVTLPNGVHHAYYVPDATMEELQDMGESVKTDARASTTLVDTNVNSDLVFSFRQIGDIVKLGGESFRYIGSTDDGYMKLLAEYPIDISTLKQSRNGFTRSSFAVSSNDDDYIYNYNNVDVWNYSGYSNSVVKSYVDQYISSLYDSNFDFNSGRLLTLDEFINLSEFELDESAEYFHGDEYGDIEITNGNYWLINSDYWLYDTISASSSFWFYRYIEDPDCEEPSTDDIPSDVDLPEPTECEMIKDEFGEEIDLSRNYAIDYDEFEEYDITNESGIRPLIFIKPKQN